MDEKLIRKVTDAIEAALRNPGSDSCCAADKSGSRASRSVSIEIKGCCEDDAPRETSSPRVVCVCLADKETCG